MEVLLGRNLSFHSVIVTDVKVEESDRKKEYTTLSRSEYARR
jgi:hypothetical protein